MKVFLAAQVLSISTSTALRFLEFEIKDQEFDKASPTSTFCLNIYNIFDVLNTKNKFSKVPGRSAITASTLFELRQKIDVWINYIWNLSVDVPKKSNRNSANKCNVPSKFVRKSITTTSYTKTGFIGFIICLENFYSLCLDIFNKKLSTYVLSYKLSQEYVEMLSALVRRINGFTLNPTTVQFKSAFKKLLANNMNVMISRHVNCLPQDETFMIGSSLHYEE